MSEDKSIRDDENQNIKIIFRKHHANKLAEHNHMLRDVITTTSEVTEDLHASLGAHFSLTYNVLYRGGDLNSRAFLNTLRDNEIICAFLYRIIDKNYREKKSEKISTSFFFFFLKNLFC